MQEIKIRQIKIDRRLCKGCGICIELCPERVISLGGRADRMDGVDRILSEKCRGCRLCEAYCPDFAVEVL